MAKRAVRQGILARSSASGYDQVNFRGAGLPVRRMQPYGLRSRPPAGAMLTLVSVNAGRTNVAYLAAEKPGQGPDPLRAGGAAMKALQSLRGFLHPRLAFSLGTALMGFLLLVAGYPRYALTYFGLSVLGVAVAAVLKRWRR